jgi:ABC-type transport system involved in multi-copper enzyme maturation permease subunit
MELPIMTREYNGGLYHAWVWYGSKNVSEVAFQMFFPLVFLTPLYFMVGFGPNDPTLFFSMYLFIALISSCATGLGYMVSCLTRSPDIAPILGILIILPFLIFGGLFLNAEQTPVYFSWLEAISPLKYGYRGISRAFWSSIPVIPCTPDQRCLATSGTQVLKNLSFDKSSMLLDAVLLLVLNIAFRLLGILSLWLKIRNKGS